MAEDLPLKRSPLVYLKDILAEIEFLKAATSGLTFEQYVTSGEKRRAIERSLEIISEASRGVSETDKAIHSDVPWRRIQDLGNVIRHAYFGLEHSRLFAIVQNDIDPLERVVRSLIAKHQGS